MINIRSPEETVDLIIPPVDDALLGVAVIGGGVEKGAERGAGVAGTAGTTGAAAVIGAGVGIGLGIGIPRATDIRLFRASLLCRRVKSGLIFSFRSESVTRKFKTETLVASKFRELESTKIIMKKI